MSSSRQLAAIMFTDIVGYTALMGRDEHGAFNLLKHNREIQKPLIRHFNGTWIKELGDGVLASFHTVTDAVLCANALHDACKKVEGLMLRIGIHLGEVVFENNDVFGDGVNIASRLQALAPAGGTLISESVYKNVMNRNEFITVFIREENLKNVHDPVKIYEIRLKETVILDPGILQKKEKKLLPDFNKKFVFGLITLIALAAISWYVFVYQKQDDAAVAFKSEKSIAVLPFVNMSGDKDQEYFSDGLSESLLNLLSKIPELKVIGRTSSFSFKGKNEDLRVIGEKLGVAHILEGSVQKEGKKIRVTAQLIRTTDGSHLWGGKYDRELEGIFKLHDEIAEAVVHELKLKLLKTKSDLASAPVNLEAYNLILQGNYFQEKRDKVNLDIALDFYIKALAIDSLNARSWAALAYCYTLQSSWAWIDPIQGMQKAREGAIKAIELDSNLFEAHQVMGAVKMWNFEWAEAEAEYNKAIKLGPGNADNYRLKAFLYRTLGRFDEAINLYKKSIELDPIKSHTYFNYGQLLYHSNRLDEAIVAYKKVLELYPQFPRTHIFLGKVYLLQGKPEKALAEMQQETNEAWRNFGLMLAYQALGRKKEVEKMLNDYIVKFAKDEAYQIAEVYAFRGEKDKAFEWLEKAYLAKDSRLTYLKGDPLLKNLENHPRYHAFLKKMNLPAA